MRGFGLFLTKVGPAGEAFRCILIAACFFSGDIITFDSRLEILKDLSGLEGVSVIEAGTLLYMVLGPLAILEYCLEAWKKLR